MELTILGASAATQNPGGACSSYLIRQGATTLLLDCGSGSFANLQRYVAPDAVTAVLISHLHADHILDLIPYRYWLQFKQSTLSPRLLLPPGGEATLLALSALQDPSPAFYSQRFTVEEYDPQLTLAIGDLTVRFVPTHHAPHTYGMRVQGTATLAYSADSGECPALLDLARGADLFLCENANPAGSDFALHLTAAQAGRYAREAGAKGLLLTHRWHEHSVESAHQEAAAEFSGPITTAHEHDTHMIG